MKIYQSLPTPKTARKAWGYFTKRYGREPTEIFYGVDGHCGARVWFADYPHLMQFWDSSVGECQGIRTITVDELRNL